MERIHVSVRSRPLSLEDAKASPWRISGNSIFMPNHSSKFDFDRIFQEDCKTSEVYSSRTKDIVAAAIRGFNGTVFAYGQTSSGKTHTMRGSASEPGVIPLAVHDLFDMIDEECDREFLLRMSYLEIYNEEINDLLAPEHRRLQIHESIERGIFVAGLREEIVASPEQVLGLMEFGETHRHIGETNMNVYSSRSHTIFRMIIESREKQDADSDSSCDAVRVSVLNLVDLAGSERAAKTGAEGVRLKEGSHINKSLMTLGTVIKKLSEGVESQGGHVPYRDSKLTRILQPALGGNANTAIICNITLAQAHADETKSSLQFASRALRVTNCVHVNEILTDAALLKRQKKEIEELRAKLLDSHSEHLEEEILTLRNDLLKVELERERMALALEEEKKAQAENEKRLEEQAKKIRNLSSMVLCSSKSEISDVYKKEKRRETWCPSKLSRKTISEFKSEVGEEASLGKPGRIARQSGPLLSFEDLDEASLVESSKEKEFDKSNVQGDCTFPNPLSLLHVTSRRKLPTGKKSLQVCNSELAEIQAEYEDLIVQFETERTMNQIHVDYLRRRLAEGDFSRKKCEDNLTDEISCIERSGKSEAILVIKQLQEKIAMLEMEKSSSQQNLDSLVELATEQTISAKEKYDELYATLLSAQEEVKTANEQLNLMPPSGDENLDLSIKLSAEIQELVLEIESSRGHMKTSTFDVNDLFKYLNSLAGILADLKRLFLQTSLDVKTIITSHQKLNSYLDHKVKELESEKVTLSKKALDLHNQIAEVTVNAENSASALSEATENYELEKSDFLSQIQALQNELLCLSSSSLAREKESIRKELEKTKSKLRDTEAKMKNAMQERTKLEGEKACIERENKRLHNQKAILERDISKRDSVVGRKRDSIVDRSSNVFDPKRGRGLAIAVEQEEHRKLEVLAFEMEATIAVLEEELAVTQGEKGEAILRAESLASDINALAEELKMSNNELATLKEEIASLQSNLKKYESHNEILEGSLNSLKQEKEEMAMQLTDALLLMEEEKAIWYSKEKASIKAIEDKSKLHNAEAASLVQQISVVKEELEVCRNQCKVLQDRLALAEENAGLEKISSAEKSAEIDKLKEDLLNSNIQNERTQENLNSQLPMLIPKNETAGDELETVQKELLLLKKERGDLIAQLGMLDTGSQTSEDLKCLTTKQELDDLRGSLSSLEAKMRMDEIISNKDKAKIRMRLHFTQRKLDAFRTRQKETLDEMNVMNTNYKSASDDLKKKLAFYAGEVLRLKGELAVVGKT
ncbi:OLC1v1036517C1 [Oldenlandia corymbosa var. corymbosa]|uniref:OLC1v1036517C1 n=1 Tax=Oldenlandia corymbosa var. corymbosa TaxID=529605 RepID=A0AAV1CWE7_OLDCO|nr:OLC1v1036517C1 [Oldenlandia corymbosa var. corymbosa]